MNLSKLQETVKDREAWRAAACELVAESQTILSNKNKGEAASMRTDVDSPRAHLFTLILSGYFPPSFSWTHCPANTLCLKHAVTFPTEQSWSGFVVSVDKTWTYLLAGFLSLFGVMKTAGCGVRGLAQQGILLLSLNFLVCKMWIKSINLL